GLGMFAFACGGGAESTSPPATPTTTTVATTPPPAPTTTSTGSTETSPPPAPKPPMGELQKKTLSALWAALNAHDTPALGAVYTADCTFESPGPEGMKSMSKDDFIKMHQGLFQGVPDVKTFATRVFQIKDVAVTEWIGTGTDSVGMMGDKPT